MSERLITIAETATFIRNAAKLWSEAERTEFPDFISTNTEAGDIIPDTGGIRKVRWGRQGMGKRGGVRVIYFYHNGYMPLYLITVYAKAERENITPDEKRLMVDFVTAIKHKFKQKDAK